MADDGVVTSVAFDDAPALNAPLEGPAFIDPVFPEVAVDGDRDEELEGLLDYAPSDLPMPDEGVRRIGKSAGLTPSSALGPDFLELLVVEAEVVR